MSKPKDVNPEAEMCAVCGKKTPWLTRTMKSCPGICTRIAFRRRMRSTPDEQVKLQQQVRVRRAAYEQAEIEQVSKARLAKKQINPPTDDALIAAYEAVFPQLPEMVSD